MTRAPRLLVAAIGLVAITTAAAPGWTPYVVHRGDTLWGLARAHHTTVAALQHSNHLTGTTIYVGQVIDLPGTGATAHAARKAGAGTTTLHAATKNYTVKPGDTLTAVARATHSTVPALAALNHLSGRMVIFIGQTLKVPGPPVAVFTAKPAAKTYVAPIAASAARLASSANPSPAATQALVVAEAKRLGVDPALAQAIAYQESGFQEREVSSTDAVGVMQLEPATAVWLAGYLKTPLDRYNVNDNIRGGVTLLHLLLSQASVSDSIAGYYQGLASVRSRGMYADTKAYVASVLALRARFAA